MPSSLSPLCPAVKPPKDECEAALPCETTVSLTGALVGAIAGAASAACCDPYARFRHDMVASRSQPLVVVLTVKLSSSADKAEVSKE